MFHATPQNLIFHAKLTQRRQKELENITEGSTIIDTRDVVLP